jgi:hypothetical protein
MEVNVGLTAARRFAMASTDFAFHANRTYHPLRDTAGARLKAARDKKKGERLGNAGACSSTDQLL